MLCSITINKEIYTFKSTQVGIRLCQCQFKAISKSSDTAVYIFYYIMCQIHNDLIICSICDYLTANLQQ